MKIRGLKLGLAVAALLGSAAAAAAEATPAPKAKMVSPVPFRTFAGECQQAPVGDNQQSALLGSLVGIFAPKLAGAAIDAAGRALDAAAADKLAEVSIVLPLETMPQCVLVARGLSFDALRSYSLSELKTQLEAADLLLEIYLRPSRDGTAMALQPTWLIYKSSLDGKGGKSLRKLAATVSFATPGSATPVSVTLPLGDFAPTAEPHVFEAVGRWNETVPMRSVGSAASVWIKPPFARAAGTQGTKKTEAGTATSAVALAGEARLIRVTDAPGLGAPKPPSTATNPPLPPTASAPLTGTVNVTKTDIPVNSAVEPVSVTVKLTELTPGNKVAKFFAPVVKGSKDEVVTLVDKYTDPAELEKARKAEETAHDTAVDGYATALKEYWSKVQAFCAKEDDLNARRVKAADVLSSQVKLARAATEIDQKPPFDALIDTGKADQKAICPA